MSDRTKIEWCDATWNPVVGCSPIGTGCANCYAARRASGRLKHLPQYEGLAVDGRWTGQVRWNLNALFQPRHWRKPRRIFVCSMGDLFHPAVPAAWIDWVWACMAMDRCQHHTFLLLTKRPDRAAEWFWSYAGRFHGRHAPPQWPSHVQFGFSASTQAEFYAGWAYAQRIPAPVLFVSLEPLLGPVVLGANLRCRGGVLVGGETGAGARPMHPDWVRSIRDECAEADVPFFFKAWGEWAPSSELGLVGHLVRVGRRKSGRLLDGREWNEVPQTRQEPSAEPGRRGGWPDSRLTGHIPLG